MLECVGEVFTIKSDSLEIVTSDAERQFSPTRKTEVVLITLSGPVQTAPQGNKPVRKLKLKLEKESEKFAPFIKRRYGSEILSATEGEIEVVRRQHAFTTFDGSELDAGVDSHLHRTSDSQTDEDMVVKLSRMV